MEKLRLSELVTLYSFYVNYFQEICSGLNENDFKFFEYVRELIRRDIDLRINNL